MSCLASAGLIGATAYSLRLIQKVLSGRENTEWKLKDLSVREKLVSASLVILILYLGLLPQKVLDTAKPVISNTLNSIEQVVSPGSGLIK